MSSTYAPGLRQSAETPAQNYAPGRLFKELPPNPILPGASAVSPGHLNRDIVVTSDG